LVKGENLADPALSEEVRGFFEQYTKAFDSIDGNFQSVADTYARDGYRSGSFKNLQVVPIGGRSALATMDWELRRGDGSIIREWRQSYNVVRVDSGWQILVSTFHVR
jgi:hypothetical protein